MGLTSRPIRTVIAAVLFLAWGGALYAQNVSPGQLGTEIQNLEHTLSLAGISPAERYDTLVRLARLRQLSGNIAAAATSWLEAAAANPHDDTALIAGAYCLTAIGEWDKAALAIRPLLAADRRTQAALQARYLDASLRAWSSSGDASVLAVLAGDPEFFPLRPLIYYTLWQTVSRNPNVRGAGSAEHWMSRLLAEFPRSPEARVAAPEKAGASTSMSAVQSPLWLLPPGIATAPATRPAQPPAPSAAPATPGAAPNPAPGAAPTSGVVLQTGLFSSEANARAQSETLRRAGFAAAVSRKTVNGAERWAVTVPAGADQRRTAQELKNAGFDSFPTHL